MQIPPITKLEEAARKLVWAAKKNGTLKELTPRLIRQKIEKQLGLEEASLDASEYKSAIKTAAKSAVDEDPASDEEEEEILKPPAKKLDRKRKSDVEYEEDQQTPKSKRKSAATTSKDKEDEGSAKKKRKTVKVKKVESEHEKESDSDSEEPSPTTTTKKKKERKRKDTKQFKSLEHVPSSDMEQDEPGIINIPGPSVAKADSPKKEKKGSPLQKKVVPSKPSKDAQNPGSKSTVSQQPAPMVVGRDVSSELSELDNPTPKQKVKAANKESKTTKTKGKEKEKRSAKSSTALTKDEETIKRLKSLVLACGVRKVWSKVFQDLDSPNQQIKKLKEVLADLGMTGRMSMDQAKTIKRKRELAQELADVQQFEKSVLSKSSRSRSETTAKVAEEDDSEKDKGTDSSEDEAPKKRPTNARKSIMAFLQDQSDEE